MVYRQVCEHVPVTLITLLCIKWKVQMYVYIWSYVHVHRGGVTFICIPVRVTFRTRLLCKNNGEGTPNVLENDTVTLLPLSISHRECLQYTKYMYVPCLPSSPCIAINTYMHQVPTAQCSCCETYILVWPKCANISNCSIGGPLPHVVLLQPYDIIHTALILCCLCGGDTYM